MDKECPELSEDKGKDEIIIRVKMKLYVKKLWSTHPDLFLYLELNDAEKQYNEWTKDESFDKTFVDWLDTEIDTQPKKGSKCKCCGGRFK